jgi:excisionase family DNA binding protein
MAVLRSSIYETVESEMAVVLRKSALDEARHKEPGPETMTITETATYLKVSKSTLYRLLQRAEIPAVKIGADWRFFRDQIDRWRLSRTL